MNSDRIDLRDLNIVDVHVHVGPELGSRLYDVRKLQEELEQYHMRAVIKNHFISTTALASLAQKSGGQSRIFGSVVLNHGVGGLNPEAIRAAISGNKPDTASDSPNTEPIVVWMPSVHSRAHLETWGCDLLPEWGVDPRYVKKSHEIGSCHVVEKSGNLKDEVYNVLNLIATEDLVLATGHLSREEIFVLVPAAVAQGVRRIIVTHPFYKVTDMSLWEQQELVDMHTQLAGGRQEYQLYLEYTYTGKPIDNISFEKKYRPGIEIIGPERIILSSDAGQISWPRDVHGQPVEGGVRALPVAECWKRFIQELMDLAVAEADIVQMASANPSRLLGIAQG